MPHPRRNPFCAASALTVFALFSTGTLIAQQPAPGASSPPATPGPDSGKAAAYYHYSLGHLYEELAAAYGNRAEYINKAIENYRLVIKEDPSATFLLEDIAELYRASGRIREAVEEAQNALKANPNDLNARKVLAHIYTQQIGDAQTNHVDEGMARRAIEQYKLITEKDPKDADSLVMLGRLERVLEDSVDAEAAFKKALEVEPDNEDAVTGLASVYSDRGDARSASALLEKLTKQNPSPRAYLSLANSYESMKEYSLAADAYSKAIDMDPTHPEWQSALAQNQALAGRYDDALKTYESLATSNPREAQPYVGMAQIYREKKDFAQARKMIDKAKEIEPDNLDVRYNEVGLLEDEGRIPDAITSLKSIVDSLSKRAPNPAERSYRARMLEQLGLLYRQNEQPDLAVDSFRQIAAVDPDLGARSEAQVIDVYRGDKNFAKAQAESEAALKKYPDDRTIRQVRAQLLADQGNYDAAVADLKKLLDGKNDRETYLAIAEVYSKSKNFAEMGNALDQAEKLSTTKEEKTAVLFERGALYERQKKFDQAEKVFRQVIDADPNNASALNYLGYMLADQNVRLQEAQDLIKRAVQLEPNNYAFLDSLGWVYYRLNKLPDAQQQLERSIQLSAKDPTIHDHLGDVYFKQGKIKEAIAQWQTSLKAYISTAQSDMEPEDVAKVQKKLDSARVRLAKEQAPVKPANP